MFFFLQLSFSLTSLTFIMDKNLHFMILVHSFFPFFLDYNAVAGRHRSQ